MSRAPRGIIAPVTLSAESTEIVSVAAALTEALGAELVLVGIAPLAPRVRAAAQPERISWLAPDDQQRLLDALVRERVEELRGSLPPGVRARTLLTWGAQGAALVAAARDEQAELIVVAMRRDGALGHALHDRADRHVLHHSDVPVLVVPTRRDAFSDRPTGESFAGSVAGTLAARRPAGFVEARTQQPSHRGSAVDHGATRRGDARA